MTLPKTVAKITTAAIAFAFVPVMASAQPVQIKSAEVPIHQYDLSEKSDVVALLSDIASAAEDVCTVPGERGNLRQQIEKRGCIKDAIEEAVASINSPIVTAALNETSFR